ncbi:hypothetical protein WN944_023148 [Citrus x changshan-huyou]|uniref:Uncharacterized protein n=1 Tax=Citrus x changshan-huyou TaxID=2935761 RepID=A0AAP0N3X6_9ROSI
MMARCGTCSDNNVLRRASTRGQVRLRGRWRSVDNVTSPLVLGIRDLRVMVAGEVSYHESFHFLSLLLSKSFEGKESFTPSDFSNPNKFPSETERDMCLLFHD